MAVGKTEYRTITEVRPLGRPARIPARKKLGYVVLVYLVTFGAIGLIGEVGFRLFWRPKYWICCERWLVGSGQTDAGRKLWPDSTYRMESEEFRVRFRTNALGYRARPEPPKTARPYRVAFVGDSFTEGMQVEYDQTFCALIERGLADGPSGREVVCENFGVAATDLFEYWHRITHDVLPSQPPDALVLCLYPGNDFSSVFPDDGFDADGRPRRDHFREPGWARHALTWLNLHSRFAHYIQRSVHVASLRLKPRPTQGPRMWWTDPAIAASVPDAPAIRRSKALLEAIAEECRRQGTKLCILVVGPVASYAAKDGQSPIGRLLADWKIDVPVIDVAIAAVARPDHPSMVFPRDGHLNPTGHAFVASGCLHPLRTALALPTSAGSFR